VHQRQRKWFGNCKAQYGRKVFRLSLCLSKQSDDCSRKSLYKRGAAGRACTSVAQQEKTAQPWRSRKRLHKRVAAQEPEQAWRAKINKKIIVTEQIG